MKRLRYISPSTKWDECLAVFEAESQVARKRDIALLLANKHPSLEVTLH